MTVDDEAQERLGRELRSDERLLWSGRPRPWYLMRAALPLALFAIPWIAFSLFWMAGAAGFRVPDLRAGRFALFPLFGLPFLIIGVLMLVSPLWARSQAKRTIYAVTSQRLLILVYGRSTSVRSFDPTVLGPIQRSDRPDGTGDLLFPDQTLLNTTRGYSRLQAMTTGFVGIIDVRLVHDLIRTTFNR